jgi:hypothetical protein
MKFGLLIALTLFSAQVMAQVFSATCELEMNDKLVQEVNARFDRGEMRGEDHAVALKMLSIQRLEDIIECAKADQLKGITKIEFLDTLDHQDEMLKLYLEELNESIRICIENDRIGMATQLMMERDQHVLEVRNLQEKIRNFIKEMK